MVRVDSGREASKSMSNNSINVDDDGTVAVIDDNGTTHPIGSVHRDPKGSDHWVAMETHPSGTRSFISGAGTYQTRDDAVDAVIEVTKRRYGLSRLADIDDFPNLDRITITVERTGKEPLTWGALSMFDTDGRSWSASDGYGRVAEIDTINDETVTVAAAVIQGQMSPTDAIEAAIYAWQAFDRRGASAVELAAATVDLSNAMSDLMSWHPGYDIETGTMPWERDE